MVFSQISPFLLSDPLIILSEIKTSILPQPEILGFAPHTHRELSPGWTL